MHHAILAHCGQIIMESDVLVDKNLYCVIALKQFKVVAHLEMQSLLTGLTITSYSNVRPTFETPTIESPKIGNANKQLETMHLRLLVI